MTLSGHACQSWTSQCPHRHHRTPDYFPGLKNAGNACRNPGGQAPHGPWCYTTNASVRWEYCNVSICPPGKLLLPVSARLLYYKTLVLPILDYADMVWGDKDNASLINNLQLLQNKAAKLFLDRPLCFSAREVLSQLGWLSLEQRRLFRRCLYVYKCVYEVTSQSIELLRNSDLHSYSTRNKDDLRLPSVKRIKLGKAKNLLPFFKDWNYLDRDLQYNTILY